MPRNIRCEENHTAQSWAVILQKRRYQECRNRVLVPQSVCADKQARYQAVSHCLAATAPTERHRASRQQKRPDGYEQQANQREGSWPLAEESDCPQRSEHRPRASGERVHNGEVAFSVSSQQCNEIAELEQ